MSQEESSKPTPPDPLRGQQDNSDQELDRALAQAATLASELSESVGPAAGQTVPTSRPDASQPDLYLPPRDAGDLDNELAGLDQKLHDAAEQLGVAEPAANPLQEKPAQPPASTPDFMSDLTRPADPPAKRSPPAAPPPARPSAAPAASTLAKTSLPSDSASTLAAPNPGLRPVAQKSAVVSSGTLGIVGNLPQSITQRLQSPVHGFEAGHQDTAAPPGAGLWRRLQNRLVGVADKGVMLLEAADRPFNGLGPTLKRVLGWIAIATMATSIAVLAAALSAD